MGKVKLSPPKGDEIAESSGSKPFNKRKWREQKYNKKLKVQQYEERRQLAMARRYKKVTKDYQKSGLDVAQIYEKYDKEEGNDAVEAKPAKKKKVWLKPHEKALQRKQEHLQRQEEIAKSKAERAERLKEFQRKKAERQRKFGRKTRKGQPIMKERMEMLLEKIEKMVKK